jgi:hypothetical protein
MCPPIAPNFSDKHTAPAVEVLQLLDKLCVFLMTLQRERHSDPVAAKVLCTQEQRR